MPYFIDTELVTKEACRTIYNAQAASILLDKIPTMMKVMLLTYTALNKTGTIHIR